MDFKEYETFLCNQLSDIILKIIDENRELGISARSRAGAEISDFLEKEFTIKVNKKNINDHIYDAEQAPPGKTKNPWDARCKFNYLNREEEIWIDFKAIKISSIDSNPDIGTPSKVIKFIKEGNFYLVYVIVYYVETDSGLKFMDHNNKFVKTYLLKDVNHTFRLNPKPQLQVNISAEPEYRTREDFIKLLIQKMSESYTRQEISLVKKKEKLISTLPELLQINSNSEKRD
ncbi:hypothetical protein [Lactococcus formosensis]|uniref:hypothetical protein n=1 Tax=Lactococcus formosensis TaxID=1281486 RepID=UPI001BCD15DC|nr:hypothetical protein [Lactococcus formosensis]